MGIPRKTDEDMLLKESHCLLLPLVRQYRLLAIDKGNNETRTLHLQAKALLNPLGKVTLDKTTEQVVTTYKERLKKSGSNWEFYLIPELTEIYPISDVLRLNRHKNRNLKPMDIQKLHELFGSKDKPGRRQLKKQELINIIKFFNLARAHLDFATRIISARNDELANRLSMSQSALSKTLEHLKSLNLINIETKRRHLGIQVPNIISYSPEFIKLALNINDSDLEKLTSGALSEVNSWPKRNRNFYEVPLKFALDALQNQNSRIVESIKANSKGLNVTMEDIFEAECTETSAEQVQQERTQKLESDLKKYCRNIEQIKNQLNQSPYIICFENTKYTTVDDAVSGFKSLEHDMIEKKENAKKLYLSGDIKDQQVLNSLSYLL
jgi:DNA-binding transcriptional regulator GbsR (MarR family)